MRITTKVLTALGAAALVAGTMAGPAMADTDLPIYGGHTEVTVPHNMLHHLTNKGIDMTGADGASSIIIGKADTSKQRFTFGVTTPSNLMLEDNPIGGVVGEVTGGRIAHLGTIRLVNIANGKEMKFGDFVVNFNRMKVFATSLNGDAITPLPAFVINFNAPGLVPTYNDQDPPTKARLAGLHLHITGGAAKLLNDELNSNAFKSGMKFGKVVTVAELVKP